MGETVGEVEAGHGELGEDHLRESREGREDALALSLEGTKTSSSSKVAALHDTGGDEDPAGNGALVNGFACILTGEKRTQGASCG